MVAAVAVTFIILYFAGRPSVLDQYGFSSAVYDRNRELLRLSEGRSVMLEEYARSLIFEEEFDAGEVDKMLRQPGELASVAG